MKKMTKILSGALVLMLSFSLTNVNASVVEGVENQNAIEIVKAPRAGFTITYDGNGHTSGTVLTYEGELFSETNPAPALISDSIQKEGATFVEWNTKADGTGTGYQPGDEIVPTANMVLYAIWNGGAPAATGFTITYDGNGHTSGTVLTYDGELFSATNPAPALISDSIQKEGATFVEWNTKADGTGTGYQPGDEIVPTANMVLYAIWNGGAPVATNEFKVTYDANGATSGAVLVDDTVYNGTEAAVVLIQGTLEKTGAEFLGWNTKADGTGTTYQPGDEFTVTANMTLYALWSDTTTVTDTKTTDTTTTTTKTASATAGTSLTSGSTLPTTGNSSIANVLQLVLVAGFALVSRAAYKKSL